jgi:endonuclease/exonuclease/phosphatase family metal-dependent hydrolase
VTRRREVAAALLAGAVAIALWVLAASRPSLWPSGCERGCANAERSPGPLRVLQLNMLHGFPRFAHLDARIDLIVDEIRRREADVVLLEEVPWTATTGSVVSDLARRTGMEHLFRRANGNRRGILFEEGEAILSRFPMRDAATTELPRGNHFYQHRIALAATLDTPWGPLRAVVTHLSGDSARVSVAQIEALRNFVGSPAYPVIIGGDFNAREDSPAVVALAQEWTDLLRAASPPDTGATCCVDNLTAPPSAELHERIDYLWTTGTDGSRVLDASRILVQPQRVGEGWLRASDHAGLFAVIDLSR